MEELEMDVKFGWEVYLMRSNLRRVSAPVGGTV